MRLVRGTPLRFALLTAVMVTMAGSTCGRQGPDAAANPTERSGNQLAAAALLARPAFAQADATGDTSLADVVERAIPSVVSLSTERVSRRRGSPSPFDDPFFRRFFGVPDSMPQERLERGLGSGVYMGDRIVVTNFHVVDGADTITVTAERNQTRQAKVLGSDPPSDIAVLKLEEDLEGIAPANFGDSGALRLGDVVLAIGDPFGVGKTVTMGIISAKGRANVGITDYEDFLQTDAAINPGNSGGALVDMRGQVIGINTAILSRTGGYMGIGFAVPSDMVRPIVDSLMEHGRVVRGWLGVAIQDLTPELTRALNLQRSEGVLVSSVEPDGPAAKAGVERGDVIMAVNGSAVDSTGRLRNLIATAGAGTAIQLELMRDGSRKTLQVELQELPTERTEQRGEGRDPHPGLSGMFTEDLDAQNRQRFEVPSGVRRGAVVTRLEPGSPAARAGLRPGDVVLELNRKAVEDSAGLRRLWKANKGNVLLLVQRGPQTIFLVLERS